MMFRAESSESKGFDDCSLHENQLRHVYDKERYTSLSLMCFWHFYAGIDLNRCYNTKQNFK